MRVLIVRNCRLSRLLQRLFSRHLISEYETGKLNTPRIVAESRRQPISFIEASKAGLELLLRIRFPPIEVRHHPARLFLDIGHVIKRAHHLDPPRSEEHTSELQSLMRISYAVFCLKKKTTHSPHSQPPITTTTYLLHTITTC